jgi:copper chaperone NosL
MIARARILWVVGLLLAVGGCSDASGTLPKPLEPDANSVAYFCHMSLPEHPGPKGQAFLRGKDQPVWFASASEAFAFLETELFQPADLQVLYVNDMSTGSFEHPAPGAWIDIHKAVFVIGSSKTAAMGGNEAVPFATREAADAFVKQNGGTAVDFAAAAKALAVEQAGG